MAAREKRRMELPDWREVCTMAVLYADEAARELALILSDRLERQFPGEVEFHWTWWSFRYLVHPQLARDAALASRAANMIVLSPGRSLEPPLEVKTWMESWIDLRNSSEGAFVVLDQPVAAAISAPPQESYLRRLAERANRDYLPLSGPGPEPGSTDLLREDQDSSVMVEAHRVSEHFEHSTRWGLNE